MYVCLSGGCYLTVRLFNSSHENCRVFHDEQGTYLSHIWSKIAFLCSSLTCSVEEPSLVLASKQMGGFPSKCLIVEGRDALCWFSNALFCP